MSGDRCERCGKELSYREEGQGACRFACGNWARLCFPCHDHVVEALQDSPQCAEQARAETEINVLGALAVSGRDTRREAAELADRITALRSEQFALVRSMLTARNAPAPAAAEAPAVEEAPAGKPAGKRGKKSDA